MNDNLRDFAALILIIIAMMIIGICSGCTVTAKEIKRGKSFCEQYGGIEAVNSLHKVASCRSGHSVTVTAYND